MATRNYAKEFATEFKHLDARFKGVETFVKQVAAGKVRSLIVNGHPGIGKTHSVTKFLETHAKGNYTVLQGRVTLLSLYATLHAFKNKGKVVVLDDVDSVFSDVQGLNILKAVMDTTAKRQVHWLSSGGRLNTMGLPDNFIFNGGVILISNVGFGGGTGKLVTHLTALKDRSYCVPVADSGQDSLFKQICYMVIKRNLMTDLKVPKKDQMMLLEFIDENKDQLNTVSLRTVVNLVNIYNIDKSNWRAMASVGLLKA
jgi:hypothetical protein